MANFHLLRYSVPHFELNLLTETSASSSKDGKSDPGQLDFTPSTVYATSKLALMTFAVAFQKHLTNYVRPNKKPKVLFSQGR
ncbi:unnamed protein product, partial [Alternaria alternata]